MRAAGVGCALVDVATLGAGALVTSVACTREASSGVRACSIRMAVVQACIRALVDVATLSAVALVTSVACTPEASMGVRARSIRVAVVAKANSVQRLAVGGPLNASRGCQRTGAFVVGIRWLPDHVLPVALHVSQDVRRALLRIGRTLIVEPWPIYATCVGGNEVRNDV